MPSFDSLTWPARRWLCDRLVGQHAYSRNEPVWPITTSFGATNSCSVFGGEKQPIVFDFTAQQQRRTRRRKAS